MTGYRTQYSKAVAMAIKRGIINKTPCEVCGAICSIAHHDDYNKPLQVRFLCHLHRRDVPKGIEPHETLINLSAHFLYALGMRLLGYREPEVMNCLECRGYMIKKRLPIPYCTKCCIKD